MIKELQKGTLSWLPGEPNVIANPYKGSIRIRKGRKSNVRIIPRLELCYTFLGEGPQAKEHKSPEARKGKKLPEDLICRHLQFSL